MTEPFLGEIQIYGFSFPPKDWADCNGALINIQQASVLFSLLGTQYGGDGTRTFALPNFAGRIPCSQGAGPGLTSRAIGETFGSNTVTLGNEQMPMHNHVISPYASRGTDNRISAPTNGSALTNPTASSAYVPNATGDTTFSPMMLSPAGGNGSHENRQPFLALGFCISLNGTYPSFG